MASANCSGIQSTHASHKNGVFGLVFTISSLVLLFVCWASYFVRRRSSFYLQKRSFLLVSASLLSVLPLFSFSLREYTGRSNFPCFAVNFIPIISVGSFVLFHSLRVFRFYNRIQYHRKLSEAMYRDMNCTSVIRYSMNVDIGRIRRLTDKTQPNILHKKSQGLLTGYIPAIDNATSNELSKYLHSRLLQNIAFTSLTVGLLVILGFAISFGSDKFSCKGCELVSDVIIATTCLGIIQGSVLIWALWRVKSEPDVLGIFAELYQPVLIQLVLVGPYTILALLDPLDLYSSGMLTWTYIALFSHLLSMFIIFPKQIFLSYARRNNVLDEETMYGGLDTILSSEIGFNYFKAHLVNELAMENLLFWLEVTTWKNAYSSSDGDERKKNFWNIFEKYIARNGIHAVNISSHQYQQILKEAQSNPDAISITILDKAKREVWTLLIRHCYPRFLSSPLYSRYLKSMKGSFGVEEDESYVEDASEPDHYLAFHNNHVSVRPGNMNVSL